MNVALPSGVLNFPSAYKRLVPMMRSVPPTAGAGGLACVGTSLCTGSLPRAPSIAGPCRTSPGRPVDVPPANRARPRRRGDRVKLREFITLFGGAAAAWPPVLTALSLAMRNASSRLARSYDGTAHVRSMSLTIGCPTGFSNPSTI
jgi:hypothetical protein